MIFLQHEEFLKPLEIMMQPDLTKPDMTQPGMMKPDLYVHAHEQVRLRLARFCLRTGWRHALDGRTQRGHPRSRRHSPAQDLSCLGRKVPRRSLRATEQHLLKTEHTVHSRVSIAIE